jgi:predicted HTH transcriptional regulator
MSANELQKIISSGEASSIQFKERLEDAHKLSQELVAFSNKRWYYCYWSE